jgi:isopenicillin N synthase-like dioxygenase
VDEFGNRDTVEFINVSQDDALAWPEAVHRTYPRTVNARMDNTIVPFVKKSRAINIVLLRILEKKLGLPEGALFEKHSDEEPSGSETRCIKSPPRGPGAKNKAAIGAHTDFGSLSFLHNRLGGLQVMVPGTEEWQYVKPIPGYAICNLGDAMAIFSGGILKSNLHRVVQPPGEHTRWSLVFFTRPGESMVLEPMANLSEAVAEAISKPENARFQTGGTTAGEWFARRIKNQRIKNRKGPETWKASRGTEHRVSAY